MLNPNVTFPNIEFGGVGSMRPPPVNFVSGHWFSPPQKLGRFNAVGGVESWQPAAISATASRPGTTMELRCLGVMCVLSSSVLVHATCLRAAGEASSVPARYTSRRRCERGRCEEIGRAHV